MDKLLYTAKTALREDPVRLIERMGFLMRGTIRRCLEKAVNEQEIS